MRHQRIQEHLYDYVAGSLDDKTRAFVESHLQGCAECKSTADSLGNLRTLISEGTSPADRRPQEFWNAFVADVEKRIQEEKPDPVASLWEMIHASIVSHQRLAFSVGAGIAVLAVGFLLWKIPLNNSETTPVDFPVTVSTVNHHEPLDQYLHRSKVLLVGLSNIPVNDLRDVTFEREISHDLLTQARALERTNLDPHSAAIVRDTKRILVEFTNIEDYDIQPQMEIIRGGIQQGNLLFKIRVAETLRDSMRFTLARYNP